MPWRKIATIALVIFTSLFVLIASVAVWGKRTLFDTNRFTKVVASVLDDPAVTNAMAVKLTDSVFDAVQNTGVVADNTPSQLQPLLPVLRGALRGFVNDQVENFLASDRGQQIMVNAVRRSHQAAMRVLAGEKPGNAVNIENGAVVLNLVPAVNAVLGRVQDRGLLTDKDLPDLNDSQTPQQQIDALSKALGIDLKPTFGQVTVYENAKIANGEAYVATAQKIAEQIKRFVVLLVLVALLLIAVTILVAYDRRRTVIMLGIGVATAVVLAQIVERRLVERIPKLLTDAESRAAAESVISAFTHSVGNVNVALFVTGILTALIGFMARPGGVDLRGHATAARIVIGALALGALWIVNLHWWSLILVAAFVAVGFAAVARAEKAASGGESSSSGPPSELSPASAAPSS
ncbi:MAG TPA: hypothetical protein VK461_04770 [Acidimicrobiales bacterium]|nr:hypothetical protein [Acidimicrobiales bacterium]